MFLRALRLENVRSLRAVELAFGSPDGARRWTLLLGDNGCGKSSLLRSIALVMSGSEALPSLLVEPDAWISNGQKRALIEADVVTAENEPRTFRLALKRGAGVSEIIKDNDQNLGQLDRALAHTARNYLTVGYGVSRRSSADPHRRFPREARADHPRSRSVLTMFDPATELQSLETWAMDLEYRKGKGGLTIVRDALDSLLPDVKFHSIDRERGRLMFDTVDGLVPMSQLSDGYQNVAAWAGDLLYRITTTFPDHADPFSARGLLLIDEIDLHLHPRWQRQLRAFLDHKLPNFQIVATTHSALTAQQAGAGELYYFKRDEKTARSTLHAFEGDPQKLLSHQLLLSEAFGVSSLSSPQVQGQRERYVQLRDKKRRSKAESAELSALKVTLQDIPDWSRPTAQDKATLISLRKIQHALDRLGPAKRTKTKTAQRARKGGASKRVAS